MTNETVEGTETDPRGDIKRTASPKVGAGAAGIPLMAILIVLLWLCWPTRVDDSASNGGFSANSAHDHLNHLASEPRPTGSEANLRAGTYLAEQLERLGMTVRSERQFASSTEHTGGVAATSAAYTRSIIASADGTASSGTVLLLAHYDTVANSPGVSDNGYGVAATLEIVRVLLSHGTHPNDLVIVFSDAEEIGLLGSKAMIESGHFDPASTVVVNQEARGNAGFTQLIRATEHPSIIEAVAKAPRVQGGSEIPLLFSNHTEFDEFAPAGYPVLEFANTGGSVAYDSGSDVLADADLQALQHRGDTVLPIAHELLHRDLSGPRATSPVNYFAIPGAFVQLPQSAVATLFGVAVTIALAAAIVAGVRSRRSVNPCVTTAPRRIFGALVITVVACGLAAGSAGLWWLVLQTVRPDYASFAFEDTPRPGWHAMTMILFAAVLTAVVFFVAWRRWSTAELLVAHVTLMGVASLATLLGAPQAAHVFVVPGLVGAVALFAIAVSSRAFLTPIAFGAYAMGTVVMLAPAADVRAGGLGQAWLPAACISLMVWATLCVFSTAVPRLRWPMVQGLSVAAVVTALLGLSIDVIDPAHPRHTNLALVQGAGATHGTWISTATDAWSSRYVEGPPRLLQSPSPASSALAPDPFLGLDRPVRTGSGPAVDNKPPQLRIVDHTPSSDDRRKVTVSVDPRGADRVAIHIKEAARVRSVALAHHPLGDHRTDNTEGWFIHMSTPPGQRANFVISLVVDGAAPLEMGAMGLSTGLDGVDSYQPPDTSTTWGAGTLNNLVGVGTSLRL